MPDLPDTHAEIAELLRQAAELGIEAADAAERGDIDGAMRLDREADALRRAARLQATRPSPQRRSATRASGRAQAVASLTEMGVPAPPREIAEYHAMRFGEELDAKSLGSVRRDEERSWDAARTPRPRAAKPRTVYIAPALDYRFLHPVRGALTLSSWPLEQRLIGPTSPRVDHLRLTLNIAELGRRLFAHQPDQGDRFVTHLSRYARTVPGAIAPNQVPDVDRIVRAAHAELAVLIEEDRAWREHAAQRARQQLDEREQLWGSRAAPGLALVEGGTA